MFSLSFLSAALLGASAVLAFPHGPAAISACNLSKVQVPVAAGFTGPTVGPSFLGLGVGVQNYTCNATSGAYVSAGAVAQLFDISCFASSAKFNNITNATYATWTHVTTEQQAVAQAGYSSPILGQHYFIAPSPGAAIVPKWDFTSSGATKGNKNAFVTGAKDASAPANRPTIDVPSLQLHNTTGSLATIIYRLETVNGQPPASCSGSGTISVKYTALYYLMGYHA